MNKPEEYDDQFFPGIENRAIRFYFYLNAGLNIINQFRNLFLGILGLYFVLKLDNWILLVAMFIPCVVVLTIAGYYSVHRMNRIQEWLGIRFASHYAMKQFNYMQGVYDQLKEINAKMKP